MRKLRQKTLKKRPGKTLETWLSCGANLFFLALAIFFGYIVVAEVTKENERTQEEGALLEDTVTDKYLDSNRGVSYYIKIEFTYEGQRLEEIERVSESEYDFFQVDQTVQFHYLPDATFDRVQLVGDSNVNAMLFLGCVFSFLFFAFFFKLINPKT
jgi:hypothetical protein